MKKIALVIIALFLCFSMLSCNEVHPRGGGDIPDSESSYSSIVRTISIYAGQDEYIDIQYDTASDVCFISPGYKDTSLLKIDDEPAGAVIVNSYAELCEIIGHDELSDHRYLKSFDDAFFDHSTLVIVEAVAGTSSVECDVSSVTFEDNMINMKVSEGRLPEGVDGDCMLCVWTFLIGVKKSYGYGVNVTKY